MASRLSLYFSLLFLLLAPAAIVVASAARNTRAITSIASKERNGGNVPFGEPRFKDIIDSMAHRFLAGHEDQMIGLQDYGDARANHKHDPLHPLGAKGNNKELDG